MSDDDALLRVALHVYHGVYVDVLVGLLERLHLHLYRVRNLLVVVEQNLLADNLRDEEACGLVRELVLIEERRRVGQQLLDAAHEHVDAELVLRRDGENLGVWQQRVPALHGVAERLLVALVNLVDEQQHGYCHVLHLVEEVLVLLGVLHDVGDVEQHVGILQRRLRECEHRLLELIVRLEYAGRVREYDLRVFFVDDAHDAVARGLRLERGNADALADKLVHQRRLAHIRIAHYVYKSCFVHISFCLNKRGDTPNGASTRRKELVLSLICC